MSLLLSTIGPLLHHVESPAWTEIDRLRSKKHLLTVKPAFRPVGGDREREQRRKKRQWQHWQSAMDAAVEALWRETSSQEQEYAKVEPISEASTAGVAKSLDAHQPVSVPTSTFSFDLQQPKKIFPFTNADSSFEFTFRTSDRTPSPAANPIKLHTKRHSVSVGWKRLCIADNASEDTPQTRETTRCKRLLQKRPA
ncbi:17277_t:CDS:1, partial [Acaulospora colombiana]